MSLTALGPWVAGYSSPTAGEVYAAFANVSAVAKARGRAAALQAWMDAPFIVATSRDPSAAAEGRRIGADYSFWAFAHRDPRRPLDPPAAMRTTEIRAPTLILAGEHDIPACLEIAELLDNSVRDSSKIVMRGTGHLLHIERPEDVNAHLLRFLEEVESRPQPVESRGGTAPAGPFRPPRLDDGRVDLQGVWAHHNLTPLERPDGVATHIITPEEAARMEARIGDFFDAGGEPTEFYDDRRIAPIGGKLRSSLITDPEDGRTLRTAPG